MLPSSSQSWRVNACLINSWSHWLKRRYSKSIKSQDDVEGGAQVSMQSDTVRLDVLRLLVQVCSHHWAVHYGCFRWSVHHVVYCHQHRLHGHGSRRHERRTGEDAGRRQLRKYLFVYLCLFSLPGHKTKSIGVAGQSGPTFWVRCCLQGIEEERLYLAIR